MTQSLTPAQRALRASVAANARWAFSTKEDRLAQGETMRRNSPASLEYWADKIDPEHTLDDAERDRRARNARQAHVKLMAFKSSRARAAKRAQEAAGSDAA